MTASYVDRLLAAADGGPQLAPITDTDPHFGVERAYETLVALHAHRAGQGWRPVGRKIGFTNRTIWPRYGVYRPMWSHVWDRTVAHAADGVASVDLAGLHEPRIEPEVVFGLGSPLPAEGGSRDVLNAVAWVAAGFEIVHSVFPGWKFRAPDCTAAFGLHARLVVGPRWPIGEDERDALAALLPAFSLTLRRNGSVVETGVGANVLGSPANALATGFQPGSLTELPSTLGNWRQKGSEIRFDEAVESVLRTTDYTMREYIGPDGRVGNIYVGYYASQRSGATYHSPQNCLPGAGWVMKDPQYIDITTASGRTFRANRYTLENGIYNEVMIYWYQGRGRTEASEYNDKLNTVWNSITRSRSDGAIVRVMTSVGHDELAAIRAATDLSAQLAASLPPFVPE